MDSTSHIEQLWHNIKSIIKSIYYIIPVKNFILFLREIEWRRNQNKFENKSIIQSLEETALYVYQSAGINVYNLDYLKKLTSFS